MDDGWDVNGTMQLLLSVRSLLLANPNPPRHEYIVSKRRNSVYYTESPRGNIYIEYDMEWRAAHRY